MSKHGGGLDASETAIAMQAATALALAILGQLRRAPAGNPETLDDVLFAAARRYIELHAWRPSLTAEEVARAVGCSRAHLYRVFGQRRRTVAGCLREARLSRARRSLESDPSQPIGLVAFNSGYTDLSAFGKAFRRRFGMSPSDCRAVGAAPHSDAARSPPVSRDAPLRSRT